MTALRTAPAVEDADKLYQQLIAMHEGLDNQQSWIVNAKLILLLANHIGDSAVLREAIHLARETTDGVAARMTRRPDR